MSPCTNFLQKTILNEQPKSYIFKGMPVPLSHTVHIKHKGVKFQTLEEYLPNQFLHQLRSSNTVFGINQWTHKAKNRESKIP